MSTERQFLNDQAATAKAAIRQTLADLRGGLTKASNIRAWAKHHPWGATASAATAGFVVGAALTRPPDVEQKEESSNRPAQVPARPGKLSLLFSTVGGVLFGVVKTAIQTSIAAAIVNKDDESSNARTPLADDATEKPGTLGAMTADEGDCKETD